MQVRRKSGELSWKAGIIFFKIVSGKVFITEVPMVRFVCSCILMALVLLAGTAGHAQEEVFFTGGWPLDRYQPRVVCALLGEAFSRMDVKFRFKHYPSARSLVMANSGEADGELHRVYEFHEVSDGRFPNLIRVESQLLTMHLAVFAKAGKKDVTCIDDLRGSRIGYLRGRQNARKMLLKISSETNIAPQNSEFSLLRMVAEGRLDYALVESFDGRVLIKTRGELMDLREVGRLTETRIFTYMNKKHAALAKRLAATLDGMKRDGSFQEIVDRVHKELLEDVPPS